MSFSHKDNRLASGTHRLQAALRCLGWAFDSITLTMALLDLVSTYWVCARLAGESEWLWFGLALGGVVVGNLLCAAFAVGEYQGFIGKNLSSIHGVCRFLILVPIAQLLPFLTYVYARFEQYKCDSSAVKADNDKVQSRARDIDNKRESVVKQQVAEGIAFVPEMARSLHTLPESSDNDDSDVEKGLSVGKNFDNAVPIIPFGASLMSSLSEDALAAASFVFASRRRDWLSGVHPTTGAGKEAVAEVAESFIAMGTLEAAIKDHKKSHMYLYVAAAVWSMPQAVIQLLALIFIQHGHKQQEMGPDNNVTVVGGFYGKMTLVDDDSSQIDTETLLVISISFSLISLVLKGYAIASSATIPNILWKFFCFSADVFGVVYVFATVAERSSPQQYSPSHTSPLFFFSELPAVTWIVQLFAIKWALFCATFVLAGAFFVVYNIKSWCPANLRAVRQFVLIVAAGVILFFPSVVALEGFRLSCVALLLSNFEGKYMRQRTAFLYIYLGEWGDPRWLRSARVKLQKMCRCWSCFPFSGRDSQSLSEVQGLAVQQREKGAYQGSQLRSRLGDLTDGQSDLIKKTKDLLKHSAREVFDDFRKKTAKRLLISGNRGAADRATLRKRAAEEVSRHFATLNYFCGTTSEEEEVNSEEGEELSDDYERNLGCARGDRHEQLTRSKREEDGSAADGVGPQGSAQVVQAVRDDEQTRETSGQKQILLSMVPVPAPNTITGGNIVAGPFSYMFGKLNGEEADELPPIPRIGTMSEAKYKRFAAREDVRQRLVESLSLATTSAYERRLRLHMMSILTSPLYVIPAGTDMEVYRALRKGEIGLVKYNSKIKTARFSSQRDGTRGAEEEDAYVGDSEKGDSVRRPLLDLVEGGRVNNYDDGEVFGLQMAYSTNDCGVYGGVPVNSAQKQRTRKRRRRGGVTQWPHRMPFSEELLKAIVSPKEALVAVAVSPQELARVFEKSPNQDGWIGDRCSQLVRGESPLYTLPSCSSLTQRVSSNRENGFSVYPPVPFRTVSLCSAVPDMFADDISLHYPWLVAPVISWLMDVGSNKHFLFPVGIVMAFTVFAVGQLYSLSLPFANVALDLKCVGTVGVDEGADENLLQKISFVAYVASLTIILLLTPFVVRFIFFVRWLKPILTIFAGVGETFTVPCLFRGIEDRHIPTSEVLVREALGAHVKLQFPPLPKATSSRQVGETRCDTAYHKSNTRIEGDTSDASAMNSEKKRFVGTRRKGRGGCGNLLPLDLADVVASYIQPKAFDLRNESRADMKRIRELGRL